MNVTVIVPIALAYTPRSAGKVSFVPYHHSMTVIAARKTKDTIIFASDSILVAGYLKATEKEVIYNKLFQQNEMVIGSTGTGYEGTMMELFSRNHRPVDGNRLSVIDFFVEFREWINKRDAGYAPENDYLIAYDKKLFRTYGGLDIYEVPEFEAIGSGEDFAKAALHLGHTPREAVEVACKLSIYCSEPIAEISIDI